MRPVISAAANLPTTSAPMIDSTSGRSRRQAVREGARIDEKAGRDEEDRDEERIADELQILLRRLLLDGRVERETGEKCADDVGKLDELRERARDGDDGDHHGEVRALVVLDLPQEGRADAAQAEENQRDEDRDLDQEQRETRNGESALEGGRADGEDDQRARVGEDRRAVRDRDGLELRLAQTA